MFSFRFKHSQGKALPRVRPMEKSAAIGVESIQRLAQCFGEEGPFTSRDARAIRLWD